MTINKTFISLVFFLTLISCGTNEKSDTGVDHNLQHTEHQLKAMINVLGDTNLNPRCTNEDGSIRIVQSKDWTSGFFPGCLWLQYEFTLDPYWKDLANKHSEFIVDQQYNGKTHDMGFKMYCSFGNGYRLTKDPNYKDILIQSANTLITRYNENVGCIRSWDHNAHRWDFPVIIDNMLNLELLFWATRETKDSSYYNIAYSHAKTTLKNHFRYDNSSYHVVDYDPATGNVEFKVTHQGYSNESAWARGQAWGLYGFTMAYRETGDSTFLMQAIKIADFIMEHPNLPKDGVPYWDFNDPKIPNSPRDASAAAVICSGLYELCTFIDDKDNKYEKFAEKLMTSLSSEKYLAEDGSNNNFILKHSTGNMPKKDEIDCPIIYADYYFMEASLRKIKYEKFKSDPALKQSETLDGISLKKEENDQTSVVSAGL